MKFIFLLVIISALNIPKNVNAHIEGMTFDQKRPDLLVCQEQSNTNPNYNISILLNAHFQNILNSNSIFVGLNSPCLIVDRLKGEAPFVGANPKNGELLITPSFLQNLNNYGSEEAIASIFSHEISHITLNHIKSNKIPFRFRSASSPSITRQYNIWLESKQKLFDARSNRETFMTLQLKQLYSQIMKNDDKVLREQQIRILDKYESYLDAYSKNTFKYYYTQLLVDDQIYIELIQMLRLYALDSKFVASFHEEALKYKDETEVSSKKLQGHFGNEFNDHADINYKEREADEVGLELYVRAGYSPEKYIQGVYLSMIAMHRDIDNIEEAMGFCDDQKRNNKLHIGYKSHPSSCWRIENIKSELDRHQEYYANIRVQLNQNKKLPTIEQILDQIPNM